MRNAFEQRIADRYFNGKAENERTMEDHIRALNIMHSEINARIAEYWKTHKRVVEELPAADLDGAKMFAEIFGYKYQLKKGTGAIYYKNANDIGRDIERLAEEDIAIAYPKGNGFILRMSKVVEL